MLWLLKPCQEKKKKKKGGKSELAILWSVAMLWQTAWIYYTSQGVKRWVVFSKKAAAQRCWQTLYP